MLKDTLQYKIMLTLKWQSWYLNFRALFMKNVLFEHKMITLWNKWYFVVNKTEIMQHILKTQ